MKKIFSALLYLFITFTISAQHIADTCIYSLGITPVRLITQKYSPLIQGIYFLSVHENEQTGIEAATDFIMHNGGSFMQLAHGGERNVSFNFMGTNYLFDPNRIFSADGRRKTLDTLGLFSADADSIVAAFANSFLKKMPEPKLVIAVHNNSDENFSIKSYKKGQVYAADADEVYINKKLDADDFILTTDAAVFDFMKHKNLNVVLQDNKHCTDDGSLSVYFGKQGIAYINIEAEHGHKKQQEELLGAVGEWMKEAF